MTATDGYIQPNRIEFQVFDTDFDAPERLEEATAGQIRVIEADWKEAPIILYELAAAIAEVVRPEFMPPIPGVAFGDDGDTLIRAYIDTIDLSQAQNPNWKLVDLNDGSDTHTLALVPVDIDVAALLAQP